VLLTTGRQHYPAHATAVHHTDPDVHGAISTGYQLVPLSLRVATATAPTG
jgi:hypothetical protein